MPGTTDTQGLQYDLLSENVATATETGLERLAKQIATQLDAADTARTTALKRPAAGAGAGVYQVSGRLFGIFTNNTGRVDLYVTKNNAELFRQTIFAESNGIVVTGLIEAIATDFFGVAIFQNSGAARDADDVQLDVY